MRCKYIFDVQGRMKPQDLKAFEVDDLRFEFTLNEKQFISEISVSERIEKSCFPTLQKPSNNGYSWVIDFKSPRLEEIKEVVKQIEGMFSFWGIDSISIDTPRYEWIPENETEIQDLPLYSFSKKTEGVPDEEIYPISFELIAKPIIVAVKNKQSNVLYSFYRRGRVDLIKGENIAAIYNYYFIIESHYAAGKYKKTEVKNNLLKSASFLENIENVLNDKFFLESIPERLKSLYKEKYLSKSHGELIEYIVNLRGFLHHFSTKRKENWHPDKQDEFRLEAIFLSKLTYNLLFSEMSQKLNNDEVVTKYQQMMEMIMNGKKPSI